MLLLLLLPRLVSNACTCACACAWLRLRETGDCLGSTTGRLLVARCTILVGSRLPVTCIGWHLPCWHLGTWHPAPCTRHPMYLPCTCTPGSGSEWHLLSPKQNQDLDRARLGASRLNSPTFTSRASSTNSQPPLVSRPLSPANCHGQGNALSAVKAFSSLPRPRLRCSSAPSLPHHHNSAHMGCRSLT